MATPARPSDTTDRTDRSPTTDVIGLSKLRLAGNMTSALAVLLEAFEYGNDLGGNDWEFGIELAVLRDLGVSNSGLRWLIGGGMADHAVEVTRSQDTARSFERPPRPVFSRRACFKLTPAGAAVARAVASRCEPGTQQPRSRSEDAPRSAVSGPPVPLVPKWDRNRRELKVGSIVVKRFKLAAPAQETILAAFEESSWPQRIDNPLPQSRSQSGGPCLRKTVEALNRAQKRPLVRFCEEGGGQGVRWELIRGRPWPATR